MIPTKTDTELASRHEAVRQKCVLIAGASGLIGVALVPFLQTQGHKVRRLVRRAPTGEDEIQWNPARGELDAAAISDVDAIVNLSGENIAGGRWTAARRETILRSRVDATRTLVDAVRNAGRKPEVFVSASAVGYYGETGPEPVDEASPIGHGFLPEICLAWETHAEGAARVGVRTVVLRLGVVLAPAGGALAKLRPLFLLGLGGRIGTGQQRMSWIGIDDAVGAIHHAIVEPRCRGPINLVAPQSVTNAEFSALLARILRRPAVLPVPAFALRLFFGQMAAETVLLNTDVRPTALLDTGYTFRHPTLEGALRSALGR
jgi:uncharacterized protein